MDSKPGLTSLTTTIFGFCNFELTRIDQWPLEVPRIRELLEIFRLRQSFHMQYQKTMKMICRTGYELKKSLKLGGSAELESTAALLDFKLQSFNFWRATLSLFDHRAWNQTTYEWVIKKTQAIRNLLVWLRETSSSHIWVVLGVLAISLAQVTWQLTHVEDKSYGNKLTKLSSTGCSEVCESVDSHSHF